MSLDRGARAAGAILSLACLLKLVGCAAPVRPGSGLLDYDEANLQAQTRLLLVNVARSSLGLPSHYTTMTGVAATFESSVEFGIDGQIAETSGGGFLAPGVRGRIAENPTFNVVPLQGEEFTRGILRPLPADRIMYLIERGEAPALPLRLLTRSFLGAINPENGPFERVRNEAARAAEYRSFRRAVLHLEKLGEQDRLYVSRVTGATSVPLPGHPTVPPGTFVESLREGFVFRSAEGVVTLTDERVQHVVITDDEPSGWTEERRQWLASMAERGGDAAIFVDVGRWTQGPGAPWTLRGWLELRSFEEVVDFLACGLRGSPEFHVDPDPRTGPVEENPPVLLSIDKGPPRGQIWTRYRGATYSVEPAPHSQRAFEILYQIFQMSLSDISPIAVPPITIAK